MASAFAACDSGMTSTKPKTATAVSGVRAGGTWKEDEIVELLTYYRKKVDDGTFKKMLKRNQLFADHVNRMFHFKNPDKYSLKTANQVSDKIRMSRSLYEKRKKEFQASMRVMTETGRETDELDTERCNDAWSGWSLYHSIFGDDPNIDNPNIAEAGLPRSAPDSEEGSPRVPPVQLPVSPDTDSEDQEPHTADGVGDVPGGEASPDVEDFAYDLGGEEEPGAHDDLRDDLGGEDQNDNYPESDGSKSPPTKKAKTKTTPPAGGKTKGEPTPRTTSKDARVLQKVADQFEAMSAAKERIHKENMEGKERMHKENMEGKKTFMQMQLQHEREMFELKSDRDDARLAALLDKKHAHEERIFGGLVEVIKLAITRNNPGASFSSAPSGENR